MAGYGMSASASLLAGVSGSRSGAGSIWSALRLARSVAAERRALRDLDASALRDIGLTEEAARAEAARGVFDLPKGR